MSQKAIREYDAKKLFFSFLGEEYRGVFYQQHDSLSELEQILNDHPIERFVVKPDQLFGKRGKYGLVGVNLSPIEVVQRIKQRSGLTQKIGSVEGVLDSFLIEPFVPHTEEYYIVIKTMESTDRIQFSALGGVDIEDNRDSVRTIDLGLDDALTDSDFSDLFQGVEINVQQLLRDFVGKMLMFLREKGFVYCEINPFVLVDGKISCLDMVAKVDTCEEWRQPSWSDISWTKPFGSIIDPLEKKIEKMDAETGASLKFSTMNPYGRIGLLLGGGGASVAVMDKLADMQLVDHIINYGELSGNPNYRHNREYIQGLVDILAKSENPLGGKKRLCVLGGISNFTKIDVFCKAFVDALSEKIEDLTTSDISILVRRGGVNDTKGLQMIDDFCKTHEIDSFIADGDVFITKMIEKIE